MGLYKRGRVWWIRFTHNGKPVKCSTKVTEKRLAEKIHAKVILEISEGKWFNKTEDDTRTLGELFEKYINEYSVYNKVESGVRSDRGLSKSLINFFGNVPLVEISPKHISEYKTMCRKKGLAPATINHHTGVLGHAFSLAIKEWEWVRENPVSRVK